MFCFQHRHVILLAAGTGIAPMMPIIRHIVDNEHDDTIVSLLYACHMYEDILCKQMLDDLCAYWNFSANYFVSQSTAATVRYGDKVINSRITQQALEQCVGHVMNAARILVCGTKSFEKDMLNYLRHLGVSEECVHKF